jgi:hypothetical protein
MDLNAYQKMEESGISDQITHYKSHLLCKTEIIMLDTATTFQKIVFIHLM